MGISNWPSQPELTESVSGDGPLLYCREALQWYGCENKPFWHIEPIKPSPTWYVWIMTTGKWKEEARNQPRVQTFRPANQSPWCIVRAETFHLYHSWLVNSQRIERDLLSSPRYVWHSCFACRPCGNCLIFARAGRCQILLIKKTAPQSLLCFPPHAAKPYYRRFKRRQQDSWLIF